MCFKYHFQWKAQIKCASNCKKTHPCETRRPTRDVTAICNFVWLRLIFLQQSISDVTPHAVTAMNGQKYRRRPSQEKFRYVPRWAFAVWYGPMRSRESRFLSDWTDVLVSSTVWVVIVRRRWQMFQIDWFELSCHLVTRQLGTFCALPLHPPVLEPDFHLSDKQVEIILLRLSFCHHNGNVE